MTPQLEQAIYLLNASTNELRHVVALMLECNPFLEVETEVLGATLVERHSPAALSLHAHLREQVRRMALSPELAAMVHLLIEGVDGSGYFDDPRGYIYEHLANNDAGGSETLPDRLDIALKLLQSLEPLGVGARDLVECLTLQLRAMPQSKAQTVAITICKQHLELLARRDLNKLVAATGADKELLKAAQVLIMTCDPKSGPSFTRGGAQNVIPEVIVQ